MRKFSKSQRRRGRILGQRRSELQTINYLEFGQNSSSIQKNTFDKIVASQVLEHIVNFIPLMNELHRILKKDGILEVWVPYVRDYDHAFGDPTHVKYFDIKTFKYFDPIHRQRNIVYTPYFDVTVERIRYYQSPTFRSKLHKLSWIVRHPAKSLRTVWLHATMRPIKEC